MNKVAIVILNWNTRNHLKTFLPYLIKYTSFPGVEIVLADNASTDSSVEMVAADFPQVRIIQLDKNYGFADGYNRSLKQIEAEYFVILNSDIEVTENWLTPLVQLLENNPQIAACAPKLLSYFERDKFEYAGAAGGYIDFLGYPFCKGRVFDTNEPDNGQYDGTYPVFWATGACIVVRASVFRQLGGFDPYYFAHQEEIDLCWRMQNAGYSVYCTSQSVLYHLGGGTLPKSNPRKTYLNFRNNMVLLYKNLPTGHWVKIILPRLILDGVAALKFLTGKSPREFTAVFWAHMSFYKYIVSNPRYLNPQMKRTFPMYLNKSIVFQYFIRKQKTYKQITGL